MECNKDEAIKAKELAERKMQSNEFEGAHKIALKAQRLYPELDNINQLLAVCSVHCSSKANMIGLEKDWYGILQVDRLADEVTIKKQYRKLALVLHPDKNKFPGAEAAFKLIGEANLVLSDKTKRSAYDCKRVSFRGGPPAKPPHHPANPVAARSNFGLNGFNPQFTTQPNLQNARTASSAVDKAFWTSCPFCAVRYQYRREVVNRAVRCQNCAKPFIAYNIGSTNISSGPGSHMPSQYPHLQKEATNQTTAIPTVNPAGFPYSQPEAGPQRGNTSQVFEHFKSKEKPGMGVGSGPSKVNEMPHGSRVKSRKRSRKQHVSESSESFDTTSSDESEDFDMEEKRSKNADGHGVAINRESVRRSSRRRHDVSYYENEGDDLHTNQANIVPERKSEENVIPPDGPPKGNPNADEGAGSIPNGPEKVEVIIDSESGSDVHTTEDTVGTYTYPDPEFHDFDKDREESCFSVDQLWACYDDEDGMPRFYAHIKKILSPEFSMQFNWLEIHPDDKVDNVWVKSKLPVACGKFKRGKSGTVDSVASFSHQVQWEKGTKGAYFIYPRKGEIWALFRGWDISWTRDPAKHKEHFKYEIVEVLSDDAAGFKVGYLNKLDGYVSLFQGQTDPSSSSFFITKNEIYRFSHRIPLFRLSGTEREGVPAGAFELDPGGLPPNQNDIWYPLKEQNRNGQPNAKSPGKSSKPRCSIDVIDDDDDERPKVRKSPRKNKKTFL